MKKIENVTVKTYREYMDELKNGDFITFNAVFHDIHRIFADIARINNSFPYNMETLENETYIINNMENIDDCDFLIFHSWQQWYFFEIEKLPNFIEYVKNGWDVDLIRCELTPYEFLEIFLDNLLKN